MHKPKKEKISINANSLIIFDVDGTLTTDEGRSSWQVVHEYFNVWVPQGESLLRKFLNNEWDYRTFCEAEVALWKGRTLEEYDKAISSIEYRKGIKELIEHIKSSKAKLVIISAGLTRLVGKIAEQFKFDDFVSNEVKFNNGKISGQVQLDCWWGKKGENLEVIIKKFKARRDDVLVIGDSSADIDMFKLAGNSIAVSPTSEKVAKSADFSIKSGNLLDIIPFLQIDS